MAPSKERMIESTEGSLKPDEFRELAEVEQFRARSTSFQRGDYVEFFRNDSEQAVFGRIEDIRQDNSNPNIGKARKTHFQIAFMPSVDNIHQHLRNTPQKPFDKTTKAVQQQFTQWAKRNAGEYGYHVESNASYILRADRLNSRVGIREYPSQGVNAADVPFEFDFAGRRLVAIADHSKNGERPSRVVKRKAKVSRKIREVEHEASSESPVSRARNPKLDVTSYDADDDESAMNADGRGDNDDEVHDTIIVAANSAIATANTPPRPPSFNRKSTKSNSRTPTQHSELATGKSSRTSLSMNQSVEHNGESTHRFEMSRANGEVIGLLNFTMFDGAGVRLAGMSRNSVGRKRKFVPTDSDPDL